MVKETLHSRAAQRPAIPGISHADLSLVSGTPKLRASEESATRNPGIEPLHRNRTFEGEWGWNLHADVVQSGTCETDKDNSGGCSRECKVCETHWDSSVREWENQQLCHADWLLSQANCTKEGYTWSGDTHVAVSVGLIFHFPRMPESSETRPFLVK
jgi:hypothetical protein